MLEDSGRVMGVENALFAINIRPPGHQSKADTLNTFFAIVVRPQGPTPIGHGRRERPLRHHHSPPGQHDGVDIEYALLAIIVPLQGQQLKADIEDTLFAMVVRPQGQHDGVDIDDALDAVIFHPRGS